MKTITKNPLVVLTPLFCAIILVFSIQKASAQAELMPYGNLNGIRIKGQLMPFDTRINVVRQNWGKIKYTGKELQKPKFSREGDTQTVITNIDSVFITETVKDQGKGNVKITVRCDIHKDTLIKAIYFGIKLPKSIYANASLKLENVNADLIRIANEPGYQSDYVKGIAFTTPTQSFALKTDEPVVLLRQNDAAVKDSIQLYLPIAMGQLNKGDVFEKTYTIKVAGVIDQSPAVIKLDATKPGNEFAGLGGNFRLQNMKTDPQVIDYCLENLRVAWSRVEMPWRSWQPDINIDPTEAANNGKLNEHVRKSMEMAQRLSKMNIPVIVSAWAPPTWAVEGPLHFGPTPAGVWGNPLRKDNMQMTYKSITDYIIYLKDHYGVEVSCFSFNESDLGINIRQTGEEHLELIKGLGAYMASKGLKTKLLLGDNSDANTYKFIYPAMNDPEARQYIGAISFHSWRGWDTPTLQKWADASKQLRLPLLVGEGSIDAAAWGYPAYFEEESYALEEINLYTRLLAICQPLSILQWQLTADYSPLKGGGIFGNNEPLAPTRRFWQLKQLASTQQGQQYLPVTTDKSDITCAALGNTAANNYTLHIVNNGAQRQVTLSGLPTGLNKFKLYITDKNKDMKLAKHISITNNLAVFKLNARSYVTLISE
ncbi:hypothetical protein FFF34_014140 [Inquilinus sp. KBS0705]|nr:hypothetical protein FFF34_014140 [Inquilinus sp. KBS0705]